jgi:uncharacterized protein YuzE
MRMVYFEQEDILYLMLVPGTEVQSVELSPDVTVELDAQGQGGSLRRSSAVTVAYRVVLYWSDVG